MIAQIKRWGNSQGIRLSKELLESAEIDYDDILDVNVVNGSIVISKKYKHKTLEERAQKYGGKLGPYEEIHWGEANGREIW